MDWKIVTRTLLLTAALMLGVLTLPAVAEDKTQSSKASVVEKSDKASNDAERTEGENGEGSLPYAACDEGKNRCKPLQKSKEKYSRCMKLICLPKEEAEKEAAAKEEKVATKPIPGIGVKDQEALDDAKRQRICEVGVRKCNALRELGDRYWLCMDDTCSNKAELAKEPFCGQGKKECSTELLAYRDCVKVMCKSSEQNCAEGVEACGLPLAKYWDCVSGVCLGSVEKYKDPELVRETKFPTVPGPDGTQRRLYAVGEPNMPMLGVHAKFAFPPPGIADKDWKAVFTPEKVLVTHDILQKVECRNRSSTLTCGGAHIGTCTCSDGTRPVTKEQIAEKGYEASFGGKK